MRARLAIAASGQIVELREVVLRNKPDAFLTTSPTATVPCLHTSDGVIDESLDIMRWALGQNDPHGWLDMSDEGEHLIARNDGAFKDALDRYKYPTRFAQSDPIAARAEASGILAELQARLSQTPFLLGAKPSLADMAILPFMRQFAHVDLSWFQSQPWPNLIAWLEDFKSSDRFLSVMRKYPAWDERSDLICFSR